jgi:hypothetical protein
MTMSVTRHNYPAGRSIAFGAIGGIVAGLVMAPFILLTAMMVGMPANTIAVAMGLMFGASQDNAMMTGFGMHMLTSVLIGIIFGAVTAAVSKLRITGFGKGIGEGVITGMIAFVVLFLPISMFVMPPVLMQMMMQMSPSLTQQQAMNMLQQGMPTMIGIGVLEHLVYGAVLGAVTSALVLKVRRVGREEAATARTTTQDSQYECSACHHKFGSLEEREDHIKKVHHGVAT